MQRGRELFLVRELEEAFVAQSIPEDSQIEPNEGHLRFARYALGFVSPGELLADIGCGRGVMVRLLSRAGIRVVGTDVTSLATRHLSQVAREGGSFCIGSGVDLPFGDGLLDAVTMFDVLEHVYEAQRLLEEARRVLKPGGRLIVVSPNMLSPLHSLASLAACALGRHGFHLFRRRDPPPSPFGNHLPEVLWILFRNVGLLARKSIGSSGAPSYRVPDFRYVGWAGDTDSVYLANPIEVRWWMRRLGFAILSYQGEGRTGFLGGLAAGIWIVGRKG